MFKPGGMQPHPENSNWSHKLDRFVKDHQTELAALAWGLHLEQGENPQTIGLDLKPTPHFVYCPRESIETLNRNIQDKIQEILGLIDAYKPEQEVLMIAIGEERIKLIFFEPEPAPPLCFEQMGESTDALLERLEKQLTEIMAKIRR